MKVMIIAKLETSDHYGECINNECIYQKVKRNYMRNIPDEHINKSINDPYFIILLPKPTLNNIGSSICNLSKECNNIGHHNYKYTVRKIIYYDN